MRAGLPRGSSLLSGLAVLLLGATVLSYQACGDFASTLDQSSMSSVAQTASCEDISRQLNTQAEQILTTNCKNCHDTNGTTTGLNAFHAVFDVQKMLAEGDVIAGDSTSSLLFQKIADGTHGAPAANTTATLSPGGLPPGDLQTLSDWINQGLVTCASTVNNSAGGLLFRSDVLPVLTAHNCVKCHSSGNTANGGVGLATYADAVKTIVAGLPDGSPLIAALPKMAGAKYANSTLTDAETAKIKNWITHEAAQ